MKSTFRQKKQRGALAVSGVFIALFILTLAAVQLERLRLNSGGTFSEVEKTRRLYLARGVANQFLAQLVSSQGANPNPISYSREGYEVSAKLISPSSTPSPAQPRPPIVETVQEIRARAEAEADPGTFQEVTMRIIKRESEAPRKFVQAPETEIPVDAATTIFAYRGKIYPWHVLPPIKMSGVAVPRNNVVDLNPGPSGELFCLVDADTSDSNPGHLLRIGGPTSVTTWGGWEDLGAIPSGLSEVKSTIIYDGSLYAIWGPGQTKLSRYDKPEKKWKEEIATGGTPIQRMIATDAVSASGTMYLLAAIGSETAYRANNKWQLIPKAKATTYDANGEPKETKNEVELGEVLDSAYGLYGVWTKNGDTTIYFLRQGKWEALPAIPDYYMEDGVLKRRPGYAKDITKVEVDENTGGIVVTLNPPEGPVKIPLTLEETFKSVPKQYYLDGTLETESGNYLNPSPIAVGGPTAFIYTEYKVTGEW